MTDITEIKRELEALTAKVAKLEAERTAPRRNWPEKVKAGMIFKARFTEATWMATGRDLEVICIANGTHGGWGVTNEANDGLDYLGHARDILTIRTDAHEPTGADLVGKVCEFSDDNIEWHSRGVCKCQVDAAKGCCQYLSEKGEWFVFARLAR